MNDSNFRHVGFGIGSVNMDPSTHSVYLAGANWHAYSLPNLDGNGHGCRGDHLGVLGGDCHNLDSSFAGKRVACVDY